MFDSLKNKKLNITKIFIQRLILKMTSEHYKTNNNRLDKYPKNYNSLNHHITFCPMSNKNKNTILFIFFYFSLSHTFFSICVSFSKSYSSNVVPWPHGIGTSVPDEGHMDFVVLFLFIIFFFWLLIYSNVIIIIFLILAAQNYFFQDRKSVV